MSDETPLLSLPLILPAQAQKHVTHNEALRLLDILLHLAVLDRTRSQAPALPNDGDRHIVAAEATGTWQGQEGKIAAFWGGTWVFLSPRPGWQARVLEEEVTLSFTGTQWQEAFTLPDTLPQLGLSTSPDMENRLAVAGPASLFTHAGQGHRLKINKSAAADTASLLLQSDFTSHAEIGLLGDTHLTLQVSPDGSTFAPALTADAATARVALPSGLIASPLVLSDAADPTRRAALDISAIASGTQRSFSFPNLSSEIAVLAGAQTFNGAKTFSGSFTVSAHTATIGTSGANATYGLGSGTTGNGNSKSVNIATGGANGSTTSLTLGPAQPGAIGTTMIHGTSLSFGPTLADFDMGSANTRAHRLGLGGAGASAGQRLAVASDSALFTHAGNGVEVAVNKANLADAAMISLKSGFSTRAQLGLLGDDDLTLRLSPDGASFLPVFSAASATGRVTFSRPIRLEGQTGDPATPAEGMIWHNSTTAQLGLRLGGQTLRLDGQQGMPWLTPPSGELVVTTTGSSSGNTGSAAGAAGRIDLFPFAARADISIDRFILNCTTAVAGALARIVLYAADAQGRPQALLHDSTGLDLSTTGAKAATVSLDLRQGRIYWLGIRHSANAALSTWPTSATPDINGGTTPATTARKILRSNLAWGTPSPATWPYTSAEIFAANAPAIWLRMA